MTSRVKRLLFCSLWSSFSLCFELNCAARAFKCCAHNCQHITGSQPAVRWGQCVRADGGTLTSDCAAVNTFPCCRQSFWIRIQEVIALITDCCFIRPRIIVFRRAEEAAEGGVKAVITLSYLWQLPVKIGSQGEMRGEPVMLTQPNPSLFFLAFFCLILHC